MLQLLFLTGSRYRSPYGTTTGYGYSCLKTGNSSGRRDNQSLNHLERQLLYGKETNLV